MMTPTDDGQSGQSQLLVSRRAGRLAIVFNRPDVANALTAAQSSELVDVLREASLDPKVRVVTLAANGRHFCAGMDLRAAATAAGDTAEAQPARYPGRSMVTTSTGSQRVIAAIMDCTKPVVAIVQGPAAGLGMYMALASDLVVASTEAAFVETFVDRGLSLHNGGAHLLVSRMGMQRCKELVLLGGRLSAVEALELGLVNRVVEPSALNAAADEFVGRLASAPTIAVGLSKRLLNQAVGSSRESAFSDEAMALEINSSASDAAEGGRAFRERRPPEYVGW